MQRIKQPMFRYGDTDWDKGYLTWGFHDEDTQRREAESVLRLIGEGRPLRVLDMACGTGEHALYWAERRHSVTAVDISQTFIAEARRKALERQIGASFLVEDIYALPFKDAFDVAVWIAKALYDEQCVAAIYRSLTSGGVFIQDIRNPEHPRTKAVTGDWERWHEKDGVFKLERHWDTDDGLHHDLWIDINTSTGEVVERTNDCKAGGQDDVFRLLKEAGFLDIETRTMQGDLFTGGADPRWLWVLARKP